MRTHNLIIYHCQICGAIEHRELDDVAPHCCGTPMARAAVETIVIATYPVQDDEALIRVNQSEQGKIKF
jgi:hypothetical protein